MTELPTGQGLCRTWPVCVSGSVGRGSRVGVRPLEHLHEAEKQTPSGGIFPHFSMQVETGFPICACGWECFLAGDAPVAA